MTFQAENWQEHYKAVRARLCPVKPTVVDKPISLVRKRSATRYDSPIGPRRRGQIRYAKPIGPVWQAAWPEAVKKTRYLSDERHQQNVSIGTQIIFRTAEKHSMSPAVLMSRRNQPRIVRARDDAMISVYFACPEWSIAGIARFFGRHHTTLLHCLDKHGVVR